MFRLLCISLLLALTASAQTETQKVFQVQGVVVGLEPAEKTVQVKHQAIPDYMPAMTMPFEVKDTNELAGLQTNDLISFRLVDAGTNGWIEQIRKLASGATNASPAPGGLRRVRDVEPLSEGEFLPEYRFTNQFGKVFSTRDFKGRALAITFLFTRCPFPTFCPLMANDFAAAQQKLLSTANAPTNWHLLTITFDPEFDTPAVLRQYAEERHYNPQYWTFATGALIDITAIGEQFGLAFWRDENKSISHNLRTVVIDASGRVQKSFLGNQWTPEELVAELEQAAKAK